MFYCGCGFSAPSTSPPPPSLPPTHSIRKTTTITLEIASLIDYRSLSASDCPTWAAACQGCGSGPDGECHILCAFRAGAWCNRSSIQLIRAHLSVNVVLMPSRHRRRASPVWGFFGRWRNSHLPSESEGAVTSAGARKPDWHTMCDDSWLPCTVTVSK